MFDYKIENTDENTYPGLKPDFHVTDTDVLVKPPSVVKIDIPSAINININLILVQLIISTIASVDKMISLSPPSKDSINISTSDYSKYSNSEYLNMIKDEINDDKSIDAKELKISNLSIMRIRNDTGLVLSYWHEGDPDSGSKPYSGSNPAIQVCLVPHVCIILIILMISCFTISVCFLTHIM